MRVYEEVVRFHILSEHELCGEEASSACVVPPAGAAQRQCKPLMCLMRCSLALPPHPACAVTDMEGFDSHLNMEQMNKVCACVHASVAHPPIVDPGLRP